MVLIGRFGDVRPKQYKRDKSCRLDGRKRVSTDSHTGFMPAARLKEAPPPMLKRRADPHRGDHQNPDTLLQ
jgi:hypothetical protein